MPAETERDSFEVETDPYADAQTQTLPEPVAGFADAYDERIGDRGRRTWQWFDCVEPDFRLACVDDEYGERVRATKGLATMFITVIDDVAEQHGDRATLEELLLVPVASRRADPTREGVDGEYVRFQQELWSAIRPRYEASPRADEFRDLLRFDLRQAFQSVDYSALLGQYPELASERELWTYDVHNMLLFVYTDIELANAPAFDRADLAAFRNVVAHVQRMNRIGNWIASWERELAEGDYSSGVVIRALESGLVSRAELREIRTEPDGELVDAVVDRIRDSGIEAAFVDRWHREYEAAAEYDGAVDSIDVRAYLEPFEPIFRSQLARRPSR